jgi:hypothetical protein
VVAVADHDDSPVTTFDPDRVTVRFAGCQK